MMTSVRFDDGMNVFTGRKPRTKADNEGGIVDLGSQVLFGQDGINHDVRF